MRRFLTLAVMAALAVSLPSCMAGVSEGEAVRRGDEAFARGDLVEALAEYRLALVQGGDDADVLMKTAHTYAMSGRIDEARDYYQRAVTMEPGFADLAASDLLRVARAAMDRNDGVEAAAAVEGATALEPGVSPTGISLPLARHFAQNGRYGQALPFFQKAARETGSDPDVVFEMALAHEEIGDCRRALVFFDQIRDEVTPARRSEVDWNIGNCSVTLAADARAEDDLEEALRLYRATIAIGEPRNRLAEAWFEIGDILASQGECRAAVDAFEQVPRQELGGGQLEDRARARVDDIRFGRGC
jgi:tetratricopeptide (TPR) repeat protein